MNGRQVLFWIAEYEDGTALPQYDLESGMEHLFSEVQLDKLKRFGWHPFPVDLAMKTGNDCNPFLSSVRIQLQDEDILIACRRNSLEYAAKDLSRVNHTTVYLLGIEGKFCLYIDEAGHVRNWEE